MDLRTHPEAVPELVPARMVNEYAYCPRLFHLEWVTRSWADNDDTEEGNFAHRNVDHVSGLVPEPEAVAGFKARSVPVSSTRLGLTAVIDVLEGDDGAVVPVDTKKGAPPDNPERSWEPERVQVCVQGLILRDAGYTCDRGQLYFAETRQRVTVEFTEELVARTLALVDGLRNAAASETAPLPLIDSPKCPRCSLVGICLPDELTTLATNRTHPVRKILPRDPDAKPLYVGEQGATLTKDGGRLLVLKGRDKMASLRLIDVASVSVFGNVQITTQLLRELFDRQVTIAYFSYGGWLKGTSQGLPSKHIELRRRQTAIAHSGGSRDRPRDDQREDPQLPHDASPQRKAAS